MYVHCISCQNICHVSQWNCWEHAHAHPFSSQGIVNWLWNGIQTRILTMLRRQTKFSNSLQKHTKFSLTVSAQSFLHLCKHTTMFLLFHLAADKRSLYDRYGKEGLKEQGKWVKSCWHCNFQDVASHNEGVVASPFTFYGDCSFDSQHFLPTSSPSLFSSSLSSTLPLLTPGGGFGFHRTAHDIFREFFGGENPFADIFNGGGFFGGMLA